MDNKNVVIFDLETRSCSSLKREGPYKYSLDPTTRATCMVFKTANCKSVILDFENINKKFEDLNDGVREVWEQFIDDGYLFTAHNAGFDMAIYKNVLVNRLGWPDIPFRQFRCTAAKAAACALPRSLEGVGSALDLHIQKDKAGYIAMMKTCKPTKEYNDWVKAAAKVLKNGDFYSVEQQPPVFLEPKVAPEVFETLYRYCEIDVLTTERLNQTLPDLIPSEQEVWFLNQQINWRGIRADIPMVKKIVDIMEGESKTALKELDTLTMGLVTKAGARKSILDFLALEKIVLPDIRAKTVEDILKGGKLSPDMKRLLEIRKALSKTSTKKYQAFLDRAGQDSRIRDILLFHGASTGRDSGTGVQLQNLPRRLISQASVELLIEILEEAERPDIDWIKTLFGENLSIAFSALLRSMVIPSGGFELFVGDFAKIEVAVLWWLAENEAGLEILRSGRDPYKYQAAANTGKRYEEI